MKNYRILIGIVIGLLLSGVIVYAESVISGNLVEYDNVNSKLTSTTVQDAIDEVYDQVPKKLCKRAITLHTEKCTNEDTSGYCRKDGYSSNGTITYGRLGTGSTLTQGDAFDCDVNEDGVYNSTNERFYYVTDLNSNIAVLIYYNNTTLGIPDNTSGSLIAYNSDNYNYVGPTTAVENLPHTGQWKTRVYSNPRQIKTETGTTSTSGGELPTFIYPTARLLTYQEIASACLSLTTSGGLKNCNYLMENTKYSSSSNGTHGYWLESLDASNSTNIWYVSSSYRRVNSDYANYASFFGVRPAIEILKSDISYS